jgi:transcriptional regulator with XRE-family HTH domain
MHCVHVFAHTVRLDWTAMPDKQHKKSDEQDTNPMSAHAFREWRKRLGLKQKDAAELLGLKKRMIQYYETGNRSGKDVSIPKSIRLACYALEAGVRDYDGHDVISEAPMVRVFRHDAPADNDEGIEAADRADDQLAPPSLAGSLLKQV